MLANTSLETTDLLDPFAPEPGEPVCEFCGGPYAPRLLELWDDDRFHWEFCCERAGDEWQDSIGELPRDAWREFFRDQVGVDVRAAVTSRSDTMVLDRGLRFEEITRREAQAFVSEHHRHNRKPQGDIFRFAVWNGRLLVGVTTVGRPVAREIDQRRVVELTRNCVRDDLDAPDLKRGACSEMYREAIRRARSLNKDRLITYTLPEEEATTVRYAGLRALYETAGHKEGWHCESRPRERDAAPGGTKICWERRLRPDVAGDLNKRAAEWRAAGRRPVYGGERRRQQSLFRLDGGDAEDASREYHILSNCPHCVSYSEGTFFCVECRRPLCHRCREQVAGGRRRCLVGRVSDEELLAGVRLVMALREREYRLKALGRAADAARRAAPGPKARGMNPGWRAASSSPPPANQHLSG